MSNTDQGQGISAGGARRTVRRLESMAWQGLIALTLLFALLLLGIVLVINTYGKRLMEGESRRRVEEIGNKAVEELQRRTQEIAGLARSVAAAAETLPREPGAMAAVLPHLIDDRGNPAVAGGAYWPEPGFFSPPTELPEGEQPAEQLAEPLSWRRDGAGPLQAGPLQAAPLQAGPLQAGPLQAAPLQAAPRAGGAPPADWRLSALPPGKVFWSASYQDPDTGKPMATCAAGSFVDGRFVGAATIDFRLAELGRLVELRQKEAGGYGFLLDRNDRFLSFPQTTRTDLVRGQATAADLAAKRAEFGPVADAVSGVERPRRTDPPGARRQAGPSNLFSTAEVPKDFITGEASVAFVFRVPDAELKLVLVTPRSQLEHTASQILRSLLFLIAGILLAVLLPTYLFVSRTWIKPVTTLAEAATLVRDGELNLLVTVPGRDEIAVLADSFNAMVERLRENAQRLQLTHAELERSLTMTDTILETVREGLFLLSPELRIEPKYSTALAEILNDDRLAGASFVDLLRSLMPEQVHELALRFLRLLFNPDKTDSVIAKINPLKEVEAAFADGSGQLKHKVLAFTFDRVRQGDEIVHAMVTVADVTQRVLLARQLKESRERMERQAELLLSVMHVDPLLLREFIESAHGELERINGLLREGKAETLSQGERNAFYRRLIELIYGRVHTIKGTAAMLRIDYFTAAAHRFEDKLTELRGRLSLEGNDFVPIVLELSEMVDSLVEVREAIGRFAEIQKSLSATAPRKDREVVESVLQRFVTDLSRKLGKQAALEVHAGPELQIPFALRKPLQSVMAQLVRNAMTHGIEPPGERATAGKPVKGRIEVHMRQQDGHFEVLLRDDGRGLDYQRLVARVQELVKTEPGLLEHLVDREQNQWRPGALDAMIFHPGFSTAEEVSETSGRGFGMSVVRETLRELGGEITLRQRPGHFCEFHIVLPAPQAPGSAGA